MSSEPFPHTSSVIREWDNTSVQIKADLNILVCRGGVLYLECMHEHVHVWWFPTRAGSFLQSDMHVPTLAIYDRKIHVHLCMYISYTSSFGCSTLSSGFINIPGINVTLLCTLHHTRYYNVQTLNQHVYIYIFTSQHSPEPIIIIMYKYRCMHTVSV